MKRNRIWKTAGCALFVLAVVFTCLCPAIGRDDPRARATFAPTGSDVSVLATTETADLAPFTREELRGLRVIPGGMAFGTKYQTDGLTVIGFSDAFGERGEASPAATAGLREKDVIFSCNGERLGSASRLSELVAESGGKPIYLTCRRNGKTFTAKVEPAKLGDGNYQIGVLLQDSGAGIGTVTFIMEENRAFAGLGHGICNAETGELIPMQSGSVFDVTIQKVKRGEPGDPGELKGYFDAGVVGTLLGNAHCGVFGVFDRLPTPLSSPVPVGLREDLHEGEATILATTSERGVRSYAVKISAINRGATGAKCFTVTVTDPELLARTGGIVQGMSGSPILQDGKLVGAVTHVLVNEPAVGYGIFLENMLTQLPLKTVGRAAA